MLCTPDIFSAITSATLQLGQQIVNNKASEL
jgi:hypothetical protein